MKTKCLRFGLMVLLAVAGFSAITMLLWNALLPDIVGISSINFWQALGLLALSRILFGGVGAGAMGHFHRHHNNTVNEKWSKMTPEQRQKFINKRMHFDFGNHFSRGHFDMDEHEDTERKTT